MRSMILVALLVVLCGAGITGSPVVRAAVDGRPSVNQWDAAPSLSTRIHTSDHRIRITENRGQIADTDGILRPDIRYHADVGATQLFFTQKGISLVFAEVRSGETTSEATGAPFREPRGGGEDAEPTRSVRLERVDMIFAGANPDAQLVADEVLHGYSNYYYGHCPDGITHVPSHGRLTYRNIYDNIDFVFTTDVGRCKYEFVVRPGGNVEDIRLRYSGARDLAFTADGGIEISAAFGGVRESAPLTYQKKGREIPSTFMLNGNEVGFMVGAYDPTQALVIDPWATYYGGSDNEQGFGIATDASGNVVICGITGGASFPVYNAHQGLFAGGGDAFVVKFDSFGSLLWATYYGGSGEDLAWDVATDAPGNVLVAGYTASANFPVQSAQQGAYAGGTNDAFVLKFNDSGVMQWASFYGGSLSDQAKGIATDNNGDVVFGGYTESSDFTVLNAFQSSNAGGRDVFIAKFSSNGVLLWATYIGGMATDQINQPGMGGGVDTDGNGNVLITGGTSSTNFPVLNAFQATVNGTDAFIASFSSAGVLQWSTFFGGSAVDRGLDIASVPNGDIAVCGETYSTDFPTQNAQQGAFGGSRDGFVLVLDGNGQRKWATYLGGSDIDVTTGIASDGNGNVSISGVTLSSNLPVLNAFQGTKAGPVGVGSDIFASQFSSSGVLQWSTYYGETGDDNGMCVSVDGSGNVVVLGRVRSSNLPVYSAWQPIYGGPADAFVIHFSPNGTLHVQLAPPAPPTNLTATVQSPTRIGLAWIDNADSESRFVVEHQTGGNPWTQFAVLSPNAESLLARNLTPQTTHRFRVKAANSMFESAYSNTAEATTPAFAAPTNLQVAASTIDEVRLTWSDNSQNETAFIIERMIAGGAWQPRDTVADNTTMYTVTGLAPSTNYSFRVTAMEDAIASAYSNTVTATTLELAAPSELEATGRSSEEVRLRWKDNTTYESYYIISLQQAGGLWIEGDAVPADVTEWLVAGLSSDTEYLFRVKAVRGTYPSAWSNTAQAKTLLYLPAPGTLTAMLVGVGEARLNWTDKSSGESGFEIERKLEGEDWQLLLTTAADVVTYLAGGLLPDTTYFFRVRAVGDNAASAWSNEVTVGTFAPPLAPSGLTAEARSHRLVRVTWQRGSANEMQFDIERKSASGGWVLVRTVNRGIFSFDDDGLDAASTYWYRVRAANSRGVSPWSVEDTATTYAVPVPSRPIGLTASAAGSSSIRLTWGVPSPQVQAGFELQESPTLNEADFRRIAPDPVANATSYDRAGLTPNTTYYYRIRAFNASGASDWSAIASARTLAADPNLPGDPFNVQAIAIGASEIRISWDMPSPSKEDGFEIEQSLTGDAGDFTRLSPNPAKAARDYTATGLQTNTTYWYRVRASNAYGYSAWSNIANATTQREPMSQALSTAMQAKEALYSGLENLIGAGDAEMAALRGIFGDYARGYDEAPARALMASWRATYPDDQARAAEALERFTIFEQALGGGFRDTQFAPPVEGAWEISRQAAGAPAVLTKDACALALAWTAQRGALGSDDSYVDAAVEDLLQPVADGTQTLLTLMGADDDAAITSFTADAVKRKGSVVGLSSRTLLSVFGYWQERMAGRYYITATQPLIASFADQCAQYDFGGSKSSAAGKRDVLALALRDRTDALSVGYTAYAGVCTGLDAAYAIGQTLAPSAQIFLQRLTQLRPRIVDGLHAAVSDADIPVERFLYLTTTTDIPGLTPLPHALQKTGSAIYHPEIAGAPGIAPPRSDDADQSTILQRVALGRVMSASTDPAIESDRAALIALREKVVAADAAYAAAQFDALRASGGGMTAAVTRAERPLLGIAPAEMYQQTALRENYYGTLARSTLLKTRRSVLSVSLADYALAPTAQKQAALVAEIDSILGPLDGVLTGLEDLKTGQAGSLITLPVLSLGDADLVRNEAAGPTKYRLRFAVANVGGAAAAQPQAAISMLTSGVTPLGATAFTFADLAVAASAGDSLELDIPTNIKAIGISATLQSGGRVFTDRRTLAVPQSTTGTGAEAQLPATVLLHQNHPNPFRPVTEISFTLPRENTVALIVTDLLGREVARLVDGERRGAGTHRVVFAARELPSGMYLYRLESEGAVLVRKMVLMR